jgi:tetratricopeptide (TPR) repeat protein
MAKRFTENRAMNLRVVGELQQKVSEKYFDWEEDEPGERLLELAEENLKESLELEDDLQARISLAELYFGDDRLDEAEQELLHAKAMNPETFDEANIELHLGEIEEGRENYEEALAHFGRVTELKPGEAHAWASLAKGYADLEDYEEAEKHFRHAIELAPDDVEHYMALSDMYKLAGEPDRAIEVLEEGASAHPDAADLLVSIATAYLEQEDYEQADIFLGKAERANPDLEMIPVMRKVLALSRTTLDTPSRRQAKGSQKNKNKKKRR